MEWHWYYIIGICITVVHAWALLSPHEPRDPDIEQMWKDNF